MFRSAQVSLCRLLLTVLWSNPGSAQVTAQYGFEDSTPQGWVSFNNASTPVNSTAAAHTGTQSLLTTTNSSGGRSGIVEHNPTGLHSTGVVNEPLDPNQSDCLSHGPFYQVLGAKYYLQVALQAARLYAPPGTQLFIDGVGHGMHNHIDNPSPLAMLVAIDLLGTIFPHLHQQVTELDLSVYEAADNTSNYGANGGAVPQTLITRQGYLYRDYFTAFRALKGKLDAVNFWGMGDDNTWLDSFPINRLDLPLPFDTRLQAKPAYWGIVDPSKLPPRN